MTDDKKKEELPTAEEEEEDIVVEVDEDGVEWIVEEVEVTASETEEEEEEKDEETKEKERAAEEMRREAKQARATKRYWELGIVGAVVLSMALPSIWGQGNRTPRLGVEYLDQSFYKTILYPERAWDLGGPNDRSTSWAVFFHKPYCGACRRVRPVFEALGHHVNASEHLRFASLDCVKYRSFCQRAGIEKEPVIRLYSAKGALLADSGVTMHHRKKRGPKFTREPVAEWQGLLIAYDVFEWFHKLQRGRLLHRDIEWPDDTTLAEFMAEFKQSRVGQMGERLDVTTSTPEAPEAYMEDSYAAVMMGLVDDIFGAGEANLEGPRLRTLLNWLEVLSFTLPKADQRSKMEELRVVLARKSSWRQREYFQQLKSWGHKEPTDESYRWCRSAVPGIGGYPCGLWLLFHTMLANSDRAHASLALKAIYAWVQAFYGCVECAANFAEEWEDNNGAEVEGHMDAVLWLWKVHNLVRERLTLEDDSLPPKRQFPAVAQCEACYTELVRNSSAGPTVEEWAEHEWQDDFVFAFLQETFCRGSDTFVCQGFNGFETGGV